MGVRVSHGTNQPSNTKYIFGPSTWSRGLIRPSLGMGLAYIDWSTQEFGIAAALSGDAAIIAAYESGDPVFNSENRLVRCRLMPPKRPTKPHANFTRLVSSGLVTAWGRSPGAADQLAVYRGTHHSACLSRNVSHVHRLVRHNRRPCNAPPVRCTPASGGTCTLGLMQTRGR